MPRKMITWLALVPAVSLPVILSACGSSPSSSTTTTTTTTAAGSTTTTVPKQPGASGTTGTTGSTTTTPSGVPNVSALLLSLNDMPSGWSEQPTSGGSTATGCASIKDLVSNNSLATADSSFAAASGAPAWFERLTAVPAAKAASTLSAALSTLNKCSTLHIIANGQTVNLKVGPMSFAKVGSQSEAWDLTGTIQGVSVRYLAVVARFGSVIGEFLYATVASTDLTQFPALMDEAATKIAAGLGSA
jgi:hypothetical protein